MQYNRSIFQALWHHLSPISQINIRLTCKNLYQWSNNWEYNQPKLYTLLNIENWKEWFKEVTKIEISTYDVFKWKWRYQKVKIGVIFVKYKDFIFLIEIRLEYEIPQHNDYSFVILSASTYNSSIHGKKIKNLPNNKNTEIFKKYREVLIKYMGSPKMQKLFPYCSHIHRRFNLYLEKEICFNEQTRTYNCCEYCNKNAKEIRNLFPNLNFIS